MKSVEFVPKTNLEEYLIESIHVDILNSFKEDIPVIYNEDALNDIDKINSDENNRLNFLNELYKDFQFFIQNMNDFNEIKYYFAFNKNNTMNFIETLVFYYDIELSSIGDDTLDYIQRQAVKAGCIIFEWDFLHNRMRKISLQYEEITNQIDSKEKLTKLLNLNTKIKSIYLREISYFEETRKDFLNLIQKEIEKLEKLHSMRLLPDDNNSDIIEVEALKEQLYNTKKEIEYHKFIMEETKAELEREQGLQLQMKTDTVRLNDELKYVKEVVSQLEFSLNVSKERLVEAFELHNQTNIALQLAEENKIKLKAELKIAKLELNDFQKSMTEISAKLQLERSINLKSKAKLADIYEIHNQTNIDFHLAEKENSELKVELINLNYAKDDCEKSLSLTSDRLNKEQKLNIQTNTKLEEVQDKYRQVTETIHLEEDKTELKFELKKYISEIDNLRNQLSKTKAKLQKEQDLHLQTKSTLRKTEDRGIDSTWINQNDSKSKNISTLIYDTNPNTEIENKTTSEKIIDKLSTKLKPFSAFLLHEDKDKLAAALRTEFSAEKGKSIRIMLGAMEQYEPALITIGKREGQKIYDALLAYFGPGIGTRQSIFDYKISMDTDIEDFAKIKLLIKHILTNLE